MNSVKTEQMLDEIAGVLFNCGYADCDIWMEDQNESYREEVGKIIEKAFEESRKEISALREAVKERDNVISTLKDSQSFLMGRAVKAEEAAKVMKWELERLSSVVCVDDGVLIDKCLSAVSKLLPEPGKT